MIFLFLRNQISKTTVYKCFAEHLEGEFSWQCKLLCSSQSLLDLKHSIIPDILKKTIPPQLKLSASKSRSTKEYSALKQIKINEFNPNFLMFFLLK